MALHEVCMSIHVRIYCDTHQTFFCTKFGGGGGESKLIFREYGFKITLKITDDP